MNREETSFLGRGMKFPPSVNMATGRFETVSDAQSVKESIYLILMTQKSERMARPNFGASIMNYTFMDTSVTMLNVMARELASDITQMEPRIDDVNVEVSPTEKEGCLIVNIGYTIRTTNVRDNMVFPFYLDATWDDEERENDAEEVYD